MGRDLRFIPEGGALVEVTCRTIHGRFLFRPSSELYDIVVGILARAQRLHPVDICSPVFMSNHMHLLLRVTDAKRLSDFMEYTNGNLAREVSRLTGWDVKIFDDRYHLVVVSNEESAQVERLRYHLSHGCKENLVARLSDWPGVHPIHAVENDGILKGYWFNRTQEYAARRRREKFDPLQYATPEELVLSPLPCWKHLPPEEYKRRILKMRDEIEAEAAAARAKTGVQPLGRKAILAQHPHHQPETMKKSPKPRIHAASHATRWWFYEVYSWFVAAYRTAATKLRAGDRLVAFPAGSFPPALPFVGG
ncbi:MAG TPA: transposase [Thermoanaerobaculia bacterium]